jgi:hypothetical protein
MRLGAQRPNLRDQNPAMQWVDAALVTLDSQRHALVG